MHLPADGPDLQMLPFVMLHFGGSPKPGLKHTSVHGRHAGLQGGGAPHVKVSSMQVPSSQSFLPSEGLHIIVFVSRSRRQS